ncbi:protein TonB [Novosphingobium hassiacum]|uniref:Protein TonB n=1 Tax=Novosphingobium hassiacum TaxID=173676 RepID=A0A7W6EVA2_9SPHN|nr:energy transducer TonB [Novosphingobium hassiacum]MBB3859760.1 protein TonB [Novosphingobium hassiacum]
MAYADQQMSGNKITALIIVAILHVVVGYALVTGLAYEAIKKVKEVTSAVNIEEEKPPEEPPPPPPKQDTPPPPIVAPPPPISFNAPAPQVQTVNVAPPVALPPAPVALPPAPAAPPPPRFSPKGAAPKGNPGSWATTNDYPSRALREEREGTTGFRVSIGTDGKVTDCQITRSSGSPDLDEATCANVRRRARFTPATDGEGQPTTGSYSNSVRWVIPKD